MVFKFKASLPTATLSSAVVLAPKASSPKETLFLPVVFAFKAPLPIATLFLPSVLAPKGAPTEVLSEAPTATLLYLVVFILYA